MFTFYWSCHEPSVINVWQILTKNTDIVSVGLVLCRVSALYSDRVRQVNDFLPPATPVTPVLSCHLLRVTTWIDFTQILSSCDF